METLYQIRLDRVHLDCGRQWWGQSCRYSMYSNQPDLILFTRFVCPTTSIGDKAHFNLNTYCLMLV